MSEFDPSSTHPLWEGAVAGFLFAAENGLIADDQIISGMSQVCVELLRQGMLNNFGEVQTYLRERGSFVQLVAQPFDASQMPDPDMRCIDILTHEPKSHYLMVSVSGTVGSEADEQLQRLLMSAEVNEATLAHDTGVLAI